MRLIKPSHRILTKIDGRKVLSNIEVAGRTCYKSEAKMSPDSANKFIKMIIDRGHESVIEHENLSVRFICYAVSPTRLCVIDWPHIARKARGTAITRR